MSALEGEGKIAMSAIDLPDPRSWAELVMGLRHAAEIDRTESADAKPHGHLAAWLAVHHIFSFLQQQRVIQNDPQVLAPVARLYNAMDDVYHGRKPAMFEGTPPNHRPSDATGFALLKGNAARALSEFRLSGMPKEEAAKRVARACGVVPGHGRVTSKNVSDWRAWLQRRPGPSGTPPKDGPALFAYQKPLPASMGSTPLERAESLIKALRAGAGATR
jgi:hypothetical protein